MAFAFSLLLHAALAVWVAVDAARRQRRWLAWAIFMAFTGLIGLVVWLIVRRRGARTVSPLGRRRVTEVALSAIATVALVSIVVVFVGTFVYQTARVQGQAMSPTLADQDRVVVNKWVYRSRDPRAGDIVMHYFPLDPGRAFIKRVVGEEGDRIRIVDGNVYRNEILIDDSFVPTDYRSHDDWGPQVVPQGYYFVMGDHRNNSSDSRHWGFVPKRYITGSVQFRWWPLRHARMFPLHDR